MKKYYIYSAETDEKIGEVTATSIIAAELKASKELNTTSDIYALTTDENEPLA